ncbi:MAG TPA: oligosaccharide flippase family protein, partial [Vicinamibacteria bacterium]|nr:oligosaccharide flippase family protein [Vicinamibacteria bacterium]
VWGVLVWVGIVGKAPIEALAAAFLVAELIRAISLQALARRHVALEMRVDLRAAWTVILVSLPFYANSLAIALGSRLDVTMLAFITHDNHEVGWYGSASNLAGLAFLLAPLMHSVLLPLLSRAYARSEDGFWRILRRAAEALIVAGTPVVLVLTLGADIWVRLAFGQPFLPAASSLRALAPQFVLTYLAVLYSMALMVRGDGWALTSISIVGVIVNPVLAFLLVPWTSQFGPGGAGIGSGLALIAAELVVASLLLWRLGRPALDSRLVAVAVGTMAAASCTMVLHELVNGLGIWRVVLDLAAYGILATVFGALRPQKLIALLRELRTSRGPAAAAMAGPSDEGAPG